MALRTRYEKEIPKDYFTQHKRKKSLEPTLKPLLHYAIDKGDIVNEGFRTWHESVERRAQARYESEKDAEMRERGLNQIDLDYSEVQITDIDRNIDYVKILLDVLPQTRNLYAHGTSM